ncbi:MAG TPA: ROK family protein, partial [Ardenticatenaceae bacterium]|nr:ROK family protein [Ardenticatenaceae bacterium]
MSAGDVAPAAGMRTAGRRGAIGLDVGGTKIAGGVVAFPEGEVVAKRVLPTLPERGGEAVLADTLGLAEALLAQAAAAGVDVAGIGMGVAELVDPEGNITSGHIIKWRGVPVQARLSR